MKADLKFLYVKCNDMRAMRHFYTELVGLNEIWWSEGEDCGLAYKCGELQFTVMQAKGKMPLTEGWSSQPGWQGGEGNSVSWSVEMDEEAFAAAVKRLLTAGVEKYRELPEWLGYWSFPVKDPMGNTCEITYAADDEPEDNTWKHLS